MPDAPIPIYDSRGNIVPMWVIRIGYHTPEDTITVTSLREGNGWCKERAMAASFLPSDIEDAVAMVQREARILGAPRLF